MQAIILCGGRGERLMPLTSEDPASMLRFAGKELIYYNIEQLVKAGADRITLALGYGGGRIKELFEDGTFQGVPVDFSGCSDEGTAAAIAYAADRNEKNILIAEGNSLFMGDLTGLVKQHTDRNAVCTALVTENAVGGCKRVCSDENGEITALTEDPSAETIGCELSLTGVYMLDTAVFSQVNFGGRRDFVCDILPELSELGGRLYACESDIYCAKILTPCGFLEAQQNILYSGGVRIINNTSDNFNGVTFIPPVYIGRNVSVQPGSVIGKGTVLDDGARIGARCRLIGSYAGVNSSLSDFCEADGTVICGGASAGRYVKFGFHSVAGSGCIIEDECELAHGAAIWSGTSVKGGTTVRDTIDRGSESRVLIDDDGIFTLPHISGSAVSAVSFALACGSSLKPCSRVVVGCSDKEGAALYLQEVKCGLANTGIDVFDIGESTPQQTAYAVNFFKAEIGIYADLNSHCTFRLMSRGGLPLERRSEHTIEQIYQNRRFRSCPPDGFGKIYSGNSAVSLYESFVRSLMPHRLKGVNPQIRACSKTAAGSADRIFRGINDINGERITFHISADGSKCTAYSQDSGNIGSEAMLCLGIFAAFSKGISVSVPYCFPSSADRIAENLCGRLYRYYNCTCGTEDSEARKIAAGEDNFFVRDGLCLCAAVCSYLSERKISLKKALEDIPTIFSSQRFVVSNCEPQTVIRKLCGRSYEIGEGAELENGVSRAIVRPMKNRQGLMIFAESMQCEQASAFCDEICARIKMLDK